MLKLPSDAAIRAFKDLMPEAGLAEEVAHGQARLAAADHNGVDLSDAVLGCGLEQVSFHERSFLPVAKVLAMYVPAMYFVTRSGPRVAIGAPVMFRRPHGR